MSLLMMVNIGILILLGIMVYSGYHNGFLWKLLNILGFFVCGFLAWWVSSYISRFLHLYPRDGMLLQGTGVEELFYDQLNHLLLFVVLFVLMQVMILALKPFAKFVNHIPLLSTANHWLGAVLGLVQGLLILLLATLCLRLPFWKVGNELVDASLLRYSEPIIDITMAYVSHPLAQLSKLQAALEEKQTLTWEEKQSLRTWLLEQNIQESDVDALMSKLE